MIIKHNVDAMNANRQYGIVNQKLENHAEKLSSGYKINRAADDAAGLSISEKMRKQIRGLSQASLNAEDGISMIQIADGAMTEIHSILDRGFELSVKAANGTLSLSDKQAIQEEIDQLLTEIDAIQNRTKFNEIYVLKGEKTNDLEQVPDGLQTVGDLPVWVASGGALNTGSLSEVYTTQETYTTTATVPTTATVSITHEAASLDFSGFNSQMAKNELIGSGFHTTCCTCNNYYSIEFTNDTGNAKERSGNHYIYKIGIGDIDPTTANAVSELLRRIIDGTDNGYPNRHYTKLKTDSANNKLYIYDDRCNDSSLKPNNVKSWNNWANHTFGVQAGMYGPDKGTFGAGVMREKYKSVVTDTHYGKKRLALQIGSESGNLMGIWMPAINSRNLKLNGVNVCWDGGAEAAMTAFGNAKESVSADRSRLGAYQNRLEHTVNNLDNVVENTTASESQIRDTDMAKEFVSYSMASIVSQTGQSMLSQANQNRQGILSLIS